MTFVHWWGHSELEWLVDKHTCVSPCLTMTYSKKLELHYITWCQRVIGACLAPRNSLTGALQIKEKCRFSMQADHEEPINHHSIDYPPVLTCSLCSGKMLESTQTKARQQELFASTIPQPIKWWSLSHESMQTLPAIIGAVNEMWGIRKLAYHWQGCPNHWLYRQPLLTMLEILRSLWWLSVSGTLKANLGMGTGTGGI